MHFSGRQRSYFYSHLKIIKMNRELYDFPRRTEKETAQGPGAYVSGSELFAAVEGSEEPRGQGCPRRQRGLQLGPRQMPCAPPW